MVSENKTEKAMPYRRGKLKSEGNVAKSQEVVSALLMLVSTGALFFISYKIFILFSDLILDGSLRIDDPSFMPSDATKFLGLSFEKLLSDITPLFILVVLIVVFGYISQFGFIFTFKPLEFNFSKLNPIEGLKDFFSLNALFELAKNSLKVILLLITFFFILYFSFHTLVFSSYMSPSQGLSEIAKLIFKLLISIGIIGLMLAGLDVAYKKFDYEKCIKMSKQEVKDEFKQFEGNIEVKAKIRRRMIELSRSRMMQEVPKASLVITNLTYFAVALRYIPKQDRTPVVVAKGQDYMAKKIIEIAELNDVPIVRKPELARALYKVVDIEEEIPPEFYKAVTEMIAYIVKRKQRGLL
ncbi:MAG: flagellar biosynthesis protein FlhB [Hydrogenobaculum sp.]